IHREDGYIKLLSQFFEPHAVEHHRLVALQSHARKDCKLTAHLLARTEEIAARQKAGDAYIAAKVIVLNRHDFQPKTETLRYSGDVLSQDGREECSRHDCSRL